MGLEACAVYGYGFQLSDEEIVEIYAKFMAKTSVVSSDEDASEDDNASEDEFVEYPEDMLSVILSCVSSECDVSLTFRKDNLRDPTYYVFFEDLAVESCDTGAAYRPLISNRAYDRPKVSPPLKRKAKGEGATTSDSLFVLINEDHIRAMKRLNSYAKTKIECDWNMYLYVC